MNTTPDTVIIAVLLIVLAIAVIAWLVVQRQRSLRLKQRFGSEYDLTVAEFRSSRTEEELLIREQELFEVASDRVAAPPPARRVAVHS